jgi:hypothetical protein
MLTTKARITSGVIGTGLLLTERLYENMKLLLLLLILSLSGCSSYMLLDNSGPGPRYLNETNTKQ